MVQRISFDIFLLDQHSICFVKIALIATNRESSDRHIVHRLNRARSDSMAIDDSQSIIKLHRASTTMSDHAHTHNQRE